MLAIYGVHPVEEALSHVMAQRKARGLWIERKAAEHVRMAKLLALAETLTLKIQRVDRQELDKLSEEGNHQGVVLELEGFDYGHLTHIIEGIGDRPRALILALDQIQDVGNFGAIVRSAAAFGVEAIIVPKDRSAPVTAAAIRASAGQLWRVPIVRVTNLSRGLEELKAANFWAASTSLAQEGERVEPIWGTDLDRRMVVVVGSEHDGVRRLVRETCDFNLMIPMVDGVESLNVSAATAVLLYEIRRQWAALGNE